MTTVPAKTSARHEGPPDRQPTAREEQMARSAEIEKMGVEEWKKRHDMRGRIGEAVKGKVVPGVSPTMIEGR